MEISKSRKISEKKFNTINFIKTEENQFINSDNNNKVNIVADSGEHSAISAVINIRSTNLFAITDNLKKRAETSTSNEALENTLSPTKSLKRKRIMDRTTSSNNNSLMLPSTADYSLINNNNNNNNNIKNERLSPNNTTDTSSRSRSVTPSPSSASRNNENSSPITTENPLLGPSVTGRNYSDFMRSLAAKYNHANPNDYFNAARNGFQSPSTQLDSHRFKSSVTPSSIGFPTALLPVLTSAAAAAAAVATNNNSTTTKENQLDLNSKKPDFASVLTTPFANSIFPPLIDMSTTQTLLAMVKSAKEAELQGLLKNVKRQDAASPLDLSSASATPIPIKKGRIKTPSSMGSPCRGTPPNLPPKRAESESPKLHEDISGWSVEDVANFITGIDICAEYAQNFRDQRIDGSGLPLLTEEHLTHTIGMKLGPALKLRSILGKKLGSCNVCLHCSHCHNNSSTLEVPGNSSNGASTSSDSGGTS